jgi:hypothetical protein
LVIIALFNFTCLDWISWTTEKRRNTLLLCVYGNDENGLLFIGWDELFYEIPFGGVFPRGAYEWRPIYICIYMSIRLQLCV